MKHVIIGTAGHIDHGKTSLIRAITGRNTDRLKEEQKRGISIELGFTYFDLPSGQRAGIIDVPGHEKFIKNMLAGVMGIDIVILVVAADESIMPQTREHLSILNMLGIEKGFIVLSKSDLMDEEWIDMVEEEVREEVIGTFLEDAKILRASSATNEGIKEVIELIDEYSEELEDKSSEDMPRLPVDRVFSMSGFGTIVTGTLLSGKMSIGDEVQIFPGHKTARIRTLQVHDEDAEVAYGGQRVAMNLAGVKKDEIDRGDTVAPIDSMKDTTILDVKINLLKDIDKVIDNRTRLRLYIGTKEVLCRIVLLDKDHLEAGDEAYAQLRLEEKVVAKRGDRFIIRFYSPMFTIGGGEILEPNPEKKKRFDEEGIRELEIKEMGSSKDIIENIIEEKSRDFPTIKDISTQTAMLEDKIKEEIRILEEEGKLITFELTKEVHVIHTNYYKSVRGKIIEELKAFHAKYPLRLGISKEEVRSRFLPKAKSRVAELFIDLLIREDYIEQASQNVMLKGFKIELKDNQEKIYKDILKLYKDSKYQPPKREDLGDLIKQDPEETDEIFMVILNRAELFKLNEEIYLDRDIYQDAIVKVKDYIEREGSVSIAEFRDLLGTNRKVALTLLEHFDDEKITIRDKDKRILNK